MTLALVTSLTAASATAMTQRFSLVSFAVGGVPAAPSTGAGFAIMGAVTHDAQERMTDSRYGIEGGFLATTNMTSRESTVFLPAVQR